MQVPDRTAFQELINHLSITSKAQQPRSHLDQWISSKAALSLQLLPVLVRPEHKPSYNKLSTLLANLNLEESAIYAGGNEHNSTYFNKVHMTAYYYRCRRMEDSEILELLPKRDRNLTSSPYDIAACRNAMSGLDNHYKNEIGFAMLLHLLSLPDFLEVKIHKFTNPGQRMNYFKSMFNKYPNLMVTMADSAGMILDTSFVYSDWVYTPNFNQDDGVVPGTLPSHAIEDIVNSWGSDSAGMILDTKFVYSDWIYTPNFNQHDGVVPGTLPSHAIEDIVKYRTRIFHRVRAVKLMGLIFRWRMNIALDETRIFHRVRAVKLMGLIFRWRMNIALDETRIFHRVRAVKLMGLIFRWRMNIALDERFPPSSKFVKWASVKVGSWYTEKDIQAAKALIRFEDFPAKLDYHKINRSRLRSCLKYDSEDDLTDLTNGAVVNNGPQQDIYKAVQDLITNDNSHTLFYYDRYKDHRIELPENVCHVLELIDAHLFLGIPVQERHDQERKQRRKQTGTKSSSDQCDNYRKIGETGGTPNSSHTAANVMTTEREAGTIKAAFQTAANMITTQAIAKTNEVEASYCNGIPEVLCLHLRLWA
ncbi:hypothetical protein NHQ30_005941 [Ciborinia camelliae]|nr:hypothetical protein NHQ30_005941 [Ciborinia camelliae]